MKKSKLKRDKSRTCARMKVEKGRRRRESEEVQIEKRSKGRKSEEVITEKRKRLRLCQSGEEK